MFGDSGAVQVRLFLQGWSSYTLECASPLDFFQSSEGHIDFTNNYFGPGRMRCLCPCTPHSRPMHGGLPAALTVSRGNSKVTSNAALFWPRFLNMLIVCASF
ncbi:hypothetical protein AX14_013453 [Amanita brunnescens Koide BX004]|nr:hypothetical protein AX14_013453 [Amanita brunnescens Koide BX004]